MCPLTQESCSAFWHAIMNQSLNTVYLNTAHRVIYYDVTYIISQGTIWLPIPLHIHFTHGCEHIERDIVKGLTWIQEGALLISAQTLFMEFALIIWDVKSFCDLAQTRLTVKMHILKY